MTIKTKFLRWLLGILFGGVSFFALVGILMYFDVIWRSPAYYPLQSQQNFAVPIMDMKTYSENSDHRRPYIYQIRTSKGSVYVLGIEHTKDSKNPQLDSIRQIWQNFQPDLALVEGRLGFLFSVFQDPVEQHGEGGLTAKLAKKQGVELYSWEQNRQEEVKALLKRFPPHQLALFYSLRPYFSDYRFGKPENPDALVQKYIENRTNYDGLRGQIRSVEHLDSLWKKDFPTLKDWRETSDEYGYPEGYLADIFNASNLARDQNLCSIITEAVLAGRKVFVTMGSSHAYRIENTLRDKLK